MEAGDAHYEKIYLKSMFVLLAYLDLCSLAQANGLIFADDFETGLLWSWSTFVGAGDPLPIVDILGGTNREREVSLSDPADDMDEEVWSSDHGAVRGWRMTNPKDRRFRIHRQKPTRSGR